MLRVVSDPGDEAHLTGRAADGDLDAFETLYRTHVGRVHAVCLRMTGDRATAEELVQEAFLRAWRKLPTFRGESAFGSWLFRLAVNVVVSHSRASGRKRDAEVLTDDLAAFERGARAQEPALAIDLERAIAALPDGARAVFVLHDVVGMRHDEVAAVMGIAVGTSKAQLHRARALLKEVLR